MPRNDGGLADEIVAARQRAGLTQEEVAARTGLSVRSIRNLESARVVPRAATVRLLRAALGLPAAPSPPAGVRPMQLPPAVPGFTGRTAQIAQLDRLVDGGPQQMTTVVIGVIAGAPGIGKTALALHWAHRSAPRFADGVLYVDLRGSGPEEAVLPPADALGGLIAAFPGAGSPAGLAARTGLYRSLVAGRWMLVVLDDARDAEQVRPLLPGVAGCVVVVTSRAPLTSLVAREVARPVVVGALTPAEARKLLRSRLGERRLAAEPDAVHAILERCGGVPQALAAVAAHAIIRPDLSLAELTGPRWGTS